MITFDRMLGLYSDCSCKNVWSSAVWDLTHIEAYRTERRLSCSTSRLTPYYSPAMLQSAKGCSDPLTCHYLLLPRGLKVSRSYGNRYTPNRLKPIYSTAETDARRSTTSVVQRTILSRILGNFAPPTQTRAACSCCSRTKFFKLPDYLPLRPYCWKRGPFPRGDTELHGCCKAEPCD